MSQARPQIILASGSAQRQKLMTTLGIPFVVKVSGAKELTKIKSNCADLVQANALLKARDIASGLKSGVVIGADTLVYLGNKEIMGKPKNLAQAKSNLRRLFAYPHWVYSGVAVIEAATKKEVVDYEKTKIFMQHLTDKEIDRYYQHMSPLDKAGGFDIEGRGAFFIRKIEGCYFNVIGLPMAKLFTMLKKVGVTLLQLALLVGFSGCATEYNLATKQHESLMYGTDKEIDIGNALSRQFDKNYKYVEDVDINERVQAIMDRIVAVCDRQDLVYSIKIIDEDKVNAVSLPGGYVYIFKGLIDKITSDDQLAGIIGHEVGHITARHSVKKLQSYYGYTLLQIATVTSGNGRMARGLDTAFTAAFLEYSQEDEFQSDRLGEKYAQKAGYDPKGMTEALKIIKDAEARDRTREFSYWRTHPHLSERIAKSNQHVKGQLEFRDYLNITGENY